jgi:hypothetical protein
MVVMDEDWGIDEDTKVDKIVLLLTPQKATLDDDERRRFSRMGMTLWEYEPTLGHDHIKYTDIGAKVIVIPLTQDGLTFYKNAHRYIRFEEKTKVMLMLKRGEPSSPFLDRKRVFHVRNVIKSIPEPQEDTMLWLNVLMTDVIPHVPGVASALTRVLGSLCS